jgi:hypothetical protein
MKKPRLLSLRAKRSNLLADRGIASPPVAARNVTVSPLQKLTTEHIEHTEHVSFMNKRIIFCHWAHAREIFTTLFLLKDKIRFSLCNLRGLCGGKIGFLQ